MVEQSYKPSIQEFKGSLGYIAKFCLNKNKRKYLEISLTKQVQDMYIENFKTSLKNIKT
jgi:hypothetical protein